MENMTEEVLARFSIADESSNGPSSTSHMKTDIPIAETWCYTQDEVVTCSFVWTINNFSLHRGEIGKCMESSIFSAKADTRFRWRLIVYPRGMDMGSQDYLGICLRLVSDECNVRVKYKFSLLNEKKEEVLVRERKHVSLFYPMAYEGFDKLISSDLLFCDRYLPNDKLTILCEVSFINSSVNVSGQSNIIHFKTPETPLSGDFEVLFENQKFTDVTLFVVGKEFRAHKVILAARSPVFQAMFEHEMEEKKRNCVDIIDIDHEVFREMLRFIYTGKVNNLKEIAAELLTAADKYALDGLKTMCVQTLYNNTLSIENAAEILQLANLHEAKQLKAQVMDYINVHAKDVMKTAGWKSLIQTHSCIMNELYEALAIRNSS